MDNIRILRQVYDDCEAERVLHYDRLSRTLNNSDLTRDPIREVKAFIEQIVRLERSQEVAVRFMTQIQEDTAKAQQKQEQEQHSHEDGSEDELEDNSDGTEEEDGK